MLKHAEKPVLGFAAYSGVGKTTLLKQLLPLLADQGVRVGLIKLSHHRFEIDIPGKDSYELRKAGAGQVLIASAHRWAMVTEVAEPAEPVLDEMLSHLDQAVLDLVLIEGFRHEAFPKIELHRPDTGQPLLFPSDPHIIAVATDGSLPVEPEIPLLDLNDHLGIRDFILNWIDKRSQ
ncbi:MAG: molybdopterin-guanine dinucleotide biosynthesis protein B [Gammaproteobacteria bacterium RIFOXYA12_FULL_61_12]|nr:MAG: molybdopterin-guanine dinucleotide biosynthesis protein B [Gammaproteobacteria bacterium RIFOXYD12_FULL_61_37]OGT92195.1 MAG: molybdopterin-guanine dinucleotide biosynthesis protein B [Gammaproteobacteria bacterium RIFOXYA12_FULL_61_12]